VRIVLSSVAAVLIGLALFEVTMHPSGSERLELAVIFVIMAVVSAFAAVFLPLIAKRSQRLIVTLFSLSLVSLVVAAVGLAIAANRMFFSEHDLTLVLVVLGFGLVASVAFAVSASRGLTEDVERMSDTARKVASGELDARTGVTRADEIGLLADELDELARQLSEATDLRRVEEEQRHDFFAAVSHDLRTPLASMQAATEALVDGVASDPDRYLASLQSDLEVIGSLVDDLFLLARAQAGDVAVEFVLTDITEVADETLEVMKPVADKRNVKLVLTAQDRVVIETAESAVGRVLRNVVDNAVRHSPSNSTVTIAVDSDPFDTGTALVTVTDEGDGFDVEFAKRAFESFTRSDSARTREGGGAGLGLAIARALVEVLGGRIWIEPGSAGVVKMSLPATRAAG
jgi:signal transduction histidine kinase